MNCNRRKDGRRGRGAALIESALVLLLFLTLVLGTIEIGRMVFAYNFVSWAASSGSRFASVRGERSGQPASAKDVRDFVMARAIGVDPRAVAVQTAWTPNALPGSVVRVTVSYDFTPLVGFLPAGRARFGSRSEATITQ
jgi:Flp pilus assembly protein TadG